MSDIEEFDPFEDLSDDELDALLAQGAGFDGIDTEEAPAADRAQGFRSGFVAVSYTHLDVYKRQVVYLKSCFFGLLLSLGNKLWRIRARGR